MSAPIPVRRSSLLPWWRQPLVWMVIAIPGSAVLVGFALLVISVKTFSGVVVDDYYEQGLQINRVLDRDRAAARHRMSARLRLDDEKHEVVVALASAPALKPPGRITVGLYHATRAGLDRVLVLRRGAGGSYAGSLAPLEPGEWDVQIEAEDWRLTGRLRAGLTRELDLVPVPPGNTNLASGSQ